MSQPEFTRRRFLGTLLATAGSGAAPFAANLLAMGEAAAASASDYKALVCLFMTGGNDHYNTVLATDPSSWLQYTRLRDTQNAPSIVLQTANAVGGVLGLLPEVAPAGRNFALHPQLGGLRTLFDAGRAAVVANVGSLVVPTTKAQYLARSVPLPPKLFSHNDQQAVWQASQAEGARVGWGGRMLDMLSSSNSNASFACISTAGNAVFLNGQTVRQYQMSSDGALAEIRGIDGRLYAGTAPLQSMLTTSQLGVLHKTHAGIVARAIDLNAQLSAALTPAGSEGVDHPSAYINPNTGAALVNPLAVQLQTVARMIASRSALGLRRQIFFVNIGGFDTHDNQKQRHANLMAQLSHGLAYFDGVLGNLSGDNMREQVTTFTASDFGRTLTSNGDGTDHGWGSHHFVIGGAVRGKTVYGEFPEIGLEHANDVGHGALLPGISIEQYAATLGAWFGLGPDALADALPNLANFSNRNLGFMG